MLDLRYFIVLEFVSTIALTGCADKGGDDTADASEGAPSGADPSEPEPLADEQPTDPAFFNGLWESSLALEATPCTGDLAALPLEPRDPDYFYYEADVTSFDTHYCSSSAECSAAPAGGFTMELVDGFWTNPKIVRSAPEEGGICTAAEVQLVVIGDEVYRVDTEYEAPGRLAATSGECLGPADGAEWACRSRDIELYQRSEAEFTLD